MLIFGVVGLLSMAANVLFQKSICLFTNVFGIPSPACGMTRAYMSLLQGDIRAAWIYHPLFLMPILICVLALCKKLSQPIIILFTILLLVVWILRLIFILPHNIEPMVYNSHALIPTLLSIVKHWIGWV
ncbi:DUF2752 domain-containing protein [Paenibacillus segetis]|uniref:DUF2752 domain-containing protein n=1 Tax=Paenibacillus segetis TaxID=1325360 RepID=UPI001E3659CB|nr:DUF2752 domain-containing protein [Paenibacillus segetis]